MLPEIKQRPHLPPDNFPLFVRGRRRLSKTGSDLYGDGEIGLSSGSMPPLFLFQFVFEKKLHVVRHVLFWLTIFLALIVLYGSSEGNYSMPLALAMFGMPLHIAFTYVVISLLVPRYLVNTQFGKFCLYFLILTLGLHAVMVLVNHFVIVPIITGISPWDLSLEPSQFADMFKSVIAFVIAASACLIRMFKYWYTGEQQKQEAQRAKISAELQLLKAQLHPHFLFNTLNNLYALVYEKSEQAAEMVMRLSGLLSYVLYECKADEVLLTKEISIIKDYITLEQERYGERLDVSFSFSGELEQQMIVPMLFQPFIENAFKHGLSEQLGKSWISVDLSVKKRKLVFKLINGYDGEPINGNPDGIGISNVQKRLELLYPGRHKLMYGIEGELYVVSLQLSLD